MRSLFVAARRAPAAPDQWRPRGLTYVVEQDLPAVGFRRGDQLLVGADGSLTMMRRLSADVLAAAIAETTRREA